MNQKQIEDNLFKRLNVLDKLMIIDFIKSDKHQIITNEALKWLKTVILHNIILKPIIAQWMISSMLLIAYISLNLV